MAVLMREAIGDTLRRVRTSRRRTLRDVSRRARVSLGYLSEVERGRKEPSSELLAAICEALEVALHELLGEAAELMARDAMVLARAADVRRPFGLRHASLRFAGANDDPTVLPLDAGSTGSPVPSAAPVAAAQPAQPGARPVALATVGGVRVAAGRRAAA